MQEMPSVSLPRGWLQAVLPEHCLFCSDVPGEKK